MSPEIKISFESTPNPQSLKFLSNRAWAKETVSFPNRQECESSPLAQKIFGFPWAEEVMVGPDYITVTKQDWVDWDVLAEPLSNLITEHVELELPVLLPRTNKGHESGILETDSEVVKIIKTIIANEIRPAVGMDGGDIVFHNYEAGVLEIYMRGSCSGCPSATITLKEGIERRLKESVPELIEVVSVN